jgi:hypothetical protein
MVKMKMLPKVKIEVLILLAGSFSPVSVSYLNLIQTKYGEACAIKHELLRIFSPKTFADASCHPVGTLPFFDAFVRIFSLVERTGPRQDDKWA